MGAIVLYRMVAAALQVAAEHHDRLRRQHRRIAADRPETTGARRAIGDQRPARPAIGPILLAIGWGTTRLGVA